MSGFGLFFNMAKGMDCIFSVYCFDGMSMDSSISVNNIIRLMSGYGLF